jgi:Nitroreductase
MLKDLLKQNRSYRGYDESVRLTREMLTDMIDCVRYAPFSQNFQAFKYYLAWTKEDCDKLQPCTHWARNLPELTLPHPGHCPTGFIVLCYDTRIGPGVQRFWKDVGICAHTILLRAAEMGLGGCMIGNFRPDEVSAAIGLDPVYQPLLVIALGKPDETVVITDLEEGGDHRYYRDENDVHYVPKRKTEDLILNEKE